MFILYCLFFCNIIENSISDDFINICYKIVEGFEDNVNFMFYIKFNPLLSFHPKKLRLNTLIPYSKESNSSQEEVKEVVYYLQKNDEPCSEAFIYKIPPIQKHITSLQMNLSWGQEPVLHIDEINIAIQSDFKESVHDVEGIFGFFKMKIVFLHEENIQIFPISRTDSFNGINWNSEVRDLIPNEIYCLRFFTKEFSKILVLSYHKFSKPQPYEYYYFYVEAYEKDPLKSQKIVRKYLVNIFPCQISENFDEFLSIYIQPRMDVVVFKLIDESGQIQHMTQYTFYSGKLRPDLLNLGFDFANLVIKQVRIKRDIFDEKDGILVYPFKTVQKVCTYSIYKDSPGSMVSKYIAMYSDGFLIKEKVITMDLSTQNLKIFKLRRGTELELRRCKMSILQ